MIRIAFKDGHSITTKLSAEDVLKRMSRLSKLIVLTEGYETGAGLSIYNKAVNAYNKADNFTGVIRLTPAEKDFLSYKLESEYITAEKIKIIKHYA